jgi:hypothetical protein
VWDNLAGHKSAEMVVWLCEHGIMGVVQKVPFPGYTGSGQSRASQRFPRFECYPDLNHAEKCRNSALGLMGQSAVD